MNGPRQLPLDLAGEPGMGRDDFIESPSNAAALALIDAWPNWPSPLVVLAGPVGAGKTHLARIWQEASGAHRVDAQSITATDQHRAESQPVLIDAITEGTIDENGLFHLINTLRQSGQSMLMTARSFPAAWGVNLADLASRLKAATVVEIGEPDDMLLSAAITKLFADRQLQVDASVVQYIASRIERSLAAAITAVDAIDRRAMETKARITRPLAARVIAEHDMSQGELDL